MMTEAVFWTRISEKYYKSPIRDPDAYERTLERVRSYLAKDDNVLEVGAGTGGTAMRLRDAVNHYTASDFSEGMLEHARSRKTGDENVTFLRADVTDRILRTGMYDAVMAFSLLHLVPDLPAALRNIHGALKPGGYFISKTVCLKDRSFWFLPLILPVMRLFGKAPKTVTRLSIDDLERQIEWAGFEIVETGNYPAKPLARFVVARKV